MNAVAQTLVLNSHWKPINVVSPMKAIRKIFADRFKCLNTETFNLQTWDEWVKDWSDLSLPIPEIVVCVDYSGIGVKHGPPKFSRTNIFLRDNNTCQFCGEKLSCEKLTMGHIIPKSRNGPTSWTNIALQCEPCNKKMKDRTPEEAGMKLLRKPFIPTINDLKLKPEDRILRKISKYKYPNSWNHFLSKPTKDQIASFVYWNSELEN